MAKTEKIEACIEYVRHMETCGIGQRDPNKCGATDARTELTALKARLSLYESIAQRAAAFRGKGQMTIQEIFGYWDALDELVALGRKGND